MIPSMDDIFDAGYAIKLPTMTGCFYIYQKECLQIKHDAIMKADKITVKRNSPPLVEIAKIDDIRRISQNAKCQTSQTLKHLHPN